MKKSEGFAVITSIIGLVVDIVAIVGLMSGNLTPSPETSLLLSRESIAVLSVTFLVLFEAVILIYITKAYNQKIVLRGITSRDKNREMTVGLIWAYSLWVPTFLLWQFWLFQTQSGFFMGLVQLAVIALGVLVGGLVLAMVTAGIYEVIEPYDDEKTYGENANK